MTGIVEYVDGRWSPASVRLGGELEDPNTGDPIGPVMASAEASVERALTVAHEVHEAGQWSAIPAAARAELLEAVADRLDKGADRIADLESRATGVVRSLTGMLTAIVGGSFRLAAAQVRAGVLLDTSLPGPTGRALEIHRMPLGPAVSLVPWNAPAPMAAHKVANALAAGCPAILKPSELAPYGTIAVAEAIAEILESTDVPAGVFQLLHGGASAGARLATDDRVRAVSFTGGAAGGAAVAAAGAAGMKPVQLELGGNNPLVAMPDVDTERLAEAATKLLTSFNGQWCRALGRLVLPDARADELLTATCARLADVPMSTSLDPAAEMGPIIHSRHLASLLEIVARHVAAGATAYGPTPLPTEWPRGNFLSPTLLTGVPLEAAREEIFGPVATVHTYRDIDEAVTVANATDFGLEAYVAGTDEEAALSVARRIRAGGVKVNGVSPLSLHLMAPRPAWGRSGLGVEGTLETLQFFTGQRVIGVEGWGPPDA